MANSDEVGERASKLDIRTTEPRLPEGPGAWSSVKQIKWDQSYMRDGKLAGWFKHSWDRWNGRHRFEDTFERDGLQITFSGWRYSLEEYARALEDAGLLIDRLREPAAPATARPGHGRWRRLPNFLHFRAVKR